MDAEIKTFCGSREIHERGVLGENVHCLIEKHFLPQMSQNFVRKLHIDYFVKGDEFAMKSNAEKFRKS